MALRVVKAHLFLPINTKIRSSPAYSRKKNNADNDKNRTLAQEQQGPGSECSRFQEEWAHIEQSSVIRNLDYSFYIHRERNEKKKVYAHIEEKISVQDDLRNCQSRAPLLFKNVKAYTSIAVDIWMEDLCLE